MLLSCFRLFALVIILQCRFLEVQRCLNSHNIPKHLPKGKGSFSSAVSPARFWDVPVSFMEQLWGHSWVCHPACGDGRETLGRSWILYPELDLAGSCSPIPWRAENKGNFSPKESKSRGRDQLWFLPLAQFNLCAVQGFPQGCPTRLPVPQAGKCRFLAGSELLG